MKNLILSLIAVIVIAISGCNREEVNPPAPTPNSQEILTFRFIADQSNFDFNTATLNFITDHLVLTVMPDDSIQISVDVSTTLWFSDGETYIYPNGIDTVRYYKTSTFLPMFVNGDTLTYNRNVTGTNSAIITGMDNTAPFTGQNGEAFVYINNNLIASDYECDGDSLNQFPYYSFTLNF